MDQLSFSALIDQVLGEIHDVLITVQEEDIQNFIKKILNANIIVTHGAGRMGIISSVFAMRLKQLGFTSYALNDVTTPAVGKEDLLILTSFSGDTQTIYDIALLGKQVGVQQVLITAQPDSRIAQFADSIVQISASNKASATIGPQSIQPMSTLAEQSLMVFFDIVVLLLMKTTHQTSEDLWNRHRNLE